MLCTQVAWPFPKRQNDGSDSFERGNSHHRVRDAVSPGPVRVSTCLSHILRLIVCHDRQRLYMILARLHTCGILHGDFRPANVLYGPRGPILIDFGHSEFAHVCPPDGSCMELRNAQIQLQLTAADLDRKRAWVAFELQRILYRLGTGRLVRNGLQAIGVTVALVAIATIISLMS